MKNISGFTLTETLITLAIFSIVSMSIVNYLTKSNQVITQAFESQEALSKKLNAMYWITSDFRSATRTSLGSSLLNGGFELAYDNMTPLYWPTINNCNYLYDNSTNTVRSGLLSISIYDSSGTTTTYDSNPFLLEDNIAYMITGWVRCNGNATSKISLVDNIGIEHGFAVLVSTCWTQVMFRFPASGNYTTGLLNADMAKISLSVQANPGIGYFDNIACTPINSVLISTTTAEINVNNTPSNNADPNDPVGFRFYKRTQGDLELYRYRIEFDPNYLVREKFNRNTNQWETSGPDRIAQGIEILKFSYDENDNLPSQGKNAPLSVTILLRDSALKRLNINEKVEFINIIPETL